MVGLGPDGLGMSCDSRLFTEDHYAAAVKEPDTVAMLWDTTMIDWFLWNRARVGSDQLGGVTPFPLRTGAGSNSARASRYVPCVIDIHPPPVRNHSRGGDGMICVDDRDSLLSHADFMMQTLACPDLGKVFFPSLSMIMY